MFKDELNRDDLILAVKNAKSLDLADILDWIENHQREQQAAQKAKTVPVEIAIQIELLDRSLHKMNVLTSRTLDEIRMELVAAGKLEEEAEVLFIVKPNAEISAERAKSSLAELKISNRTAFRLRRLG
jgi:hypothetical protein